MAVIATDDFNRANSDPISGNWSTESGMGAWKIVSNQAQPSANTDSAVYYNTGTWPNDQYSQATIAALTAAGFSGDGVGTSCRVSNSAKTNYEGIYGTGAGSSLAKRVAGAYTQLASNLTAFLVTDIIRTQAVGTTIKLQKNGVDVLTSASESSIASGSPGIIYSADGTTTSATLDNWEGGDFSAGDILFGQVIT